MGTDLRDAIFALLGDKQITADIRVKTPGIVCGFEHARQQAQALGCHIAFCAQDGDEAAANQVIMQLAGTAKAVAMAEDAVIGCIAWPSGIARNARIAVSLAENHAQIVCGAVKKLPQNMKAIARHALACGGAALRIADGPFIYLDKNYVRMFGGVARTLEAVAHMEGYTKAVQLRGELQNLADETRAAIAMGADILMVDTGRVEDLDHVARMVRQSGRRHDFKIAFAGDIALRDIPELAVLDVDILGVGRAILDSPMADCSLDVAPPQARQKRDLNDSPDQAMDLNLLEKTELRIDGISLEGANLTDLATTVAKTLDLPQDKVLVIDVRLGQVALDILMRTVRAEQIFGKKRQLLESLAQIPGVQLDPDAVIHSAGILGAISLEEDEAPQVIQASHDMTQQIIQARKARIRVFPTGFELVGGNIEDTNTPYLVKVLGEAGYLPEAAPAVPDSLEHLTEALRAASMECGLAVTTGGVGAEDKDFSVEAIEALDPDAATPYLVRFTKGEGRHVKDGVRIGVGCLNGCLLVALPGPNDEVCKAAPVLIRGLKEKCPPQELAQRLAETLREKLRHAGHNWQHAHHHEHKDHSFNHKGEH